MTLTHSHPHTLTHSLAQLLMARCSPKKIVLVTVATISVAWLGFLGYSYVFAVRQKSILRYKLEEELKRLAQMITSL